MICQPIHICNFMSSFHLLKTVMSTAVGVYPKQFEEMKQAPSNCEVYECGHYDQA